MIKYSFFKVSTMFSNRNGTMERDFLPRLKTWKTVHQTRNDAAHAHKRVTVPLMINDVETEFVTIGSVISWRRRQSILSPLVNLALNLQNVFETLNRGVMLKCIWMYISKTCNKAFRSLHKIRQIRKFLNINTTKILFQAFVFSPLDYCNALLFGSPKYQLDGFQKVQNASARVILKFSKRLLLLTYTGSLYIKFRIQIKLLSIVYKPLHDWRSRLD